MPDIGFLGPRGTFTEVALQRYLSESPTDLTPHSFEAFSLLFDALNKGDVSQIIIPIENSLGGEVFSTLDGLAQLSEQFCVSAEITVLIEQSLLAKSSLLLSEIEVLYSHEQSITQCQAFIAQHCPTADVVYCSSNAKAAEKVSALDVSHKGACIAHKDVQTYYDLTVIQETINDVLDNVTRFVVIASEPTVSTGKDKTSFIFSTHKDQPGSLCATLMELSSRNINLTRITSRPSRHMLGEYVFFVDCEGHCEDPLLQECLGVIQDKSSYYKFLGSYKRR